jgi:hypothetical protein
MQIFFKRRQDKGHAKWVEEIRERTWRHFYNPKKEPDWSLLSSGLVNDLNELNNRFLADDGLKMFWSQPGYWKDVRNLFEKHILDKAEHEDHEDDDLLLLMDHLIGKLWWYQSESNDWDRLCIPILTPKFLDALAANIEARAKAYEEVSDNYYMFLTHFIFLIHAFKRCLKACLYSFKFSYLRHQTMVEGVSIPSFHLLFSYFRLQEIFEGVSIFHFCTT